MKRRLRNFRGLGASFALLLTGILVAACGGSSHKTTSSTTTGDTTTGSGSVSTGQQSSATKTTASSKGAPGATKTHVNLNPNFVGSSASRAEGSLQSIFEAENLMHNGNPTAGFNTLRALGANRVRISVSWNAIAPDPSSTKQPKFNAANPAAYPAANWAVYDQIDRASATTGVPILLTIEGAAPNWAQGANVHSGQPYPGGSWRISASDFGAFVHAMGTRYSGHYTPAGQRSPLPKIDFWSIWNEPNAGTYLSPQTDNNGTIPTGPILYRKLVNAAWSSLQATGHGSDTILLGETAPVGTGNTLKPGIYTTTTPMRFIRELYCLDPSYKPLTGSAASAADCPSSTSTFVSQNPALFQATGWADHPYEGAASPTSKTPGTAGVGAADFANLQNIVGGLNSVMAAYGSSHNLPIYSTEFGYNTYQLSTSAAAKYLNESEYLTWINPSIKSIGQYLLNDPAPGQGNFKTGIETSAGQPKGDMLSAYTMPLWIPDTSTSKGGSLLIWGCARPSVYQRPSGTQVAIQFASGGAYKTLTHVAIVPNTSGCYFEAHVKVPSSGNIRLEYSGTTGRLYSRVQPVTVS